MTHQTHRRASAWSIASAVSSVLLSASLFAGLAAPALAGEFEQLAAKAPVYRGDAPVTAMPDGNIVAEAEEFQVKGGDAKPAAAGISGGWQARDWGENYYAATFANSFLSRKAFLQAPPQAKASEASIEVEIPAAGKYAVLARYEATYRFETQFKLRVEQNGKVVLDRLYGARNNLKLWAFRGEGGLKTEVAWYWGAVENVVWEGHDVAVDLQPGRAKITLVADAQPEPAANRNVDCVVLTRNIDDVNKRIATEAYLPLDGLLTQGGDVWVRLQNKGKAETKLVVSSGTEHSPYWVHIRHWEPVTVTALPNASSEWVEVGSLLDSLNDGQWSMKAGLIGKLPPAENTTAGGNTSLAEEFLNYRVEVGVRDAKGKIEPIAHFDSKKESLFLAYDANTRWSRRVRAADQVLFDLMAYLKKNPVPGSAPKRTIVYGYTFNPLPDNNTYEEARKGFIKYIGLTTSEGSTDIEASGPPIAYTDVCAMPLKDLEARLAKYRDDGVAARIRTVSLGDEIGLA
ncbi:MAG: hypothetical protein NTW19_03285 [Planctomycetota bacterium]|nr:hypothetical protein [Planctomycetota bacterium]